MKKQIEQLMRQRNIVMQEVNKLTEYVDGISYYTAHAKVVIDLLKGVRASYDVINTRIESLKVMKKEIEMLEKDNEATGLSKSVAGYANSNLIHNGTVHNDIDLPELIAYMKQEDCYVLWDDGENTTIWTSKEFAQNMTENHLEDWYDNEKREQKELN